ncbi:MAG: HEPN domain-containing protein [Candidatus Aerophobetes bacterium]|nr:HEPN domain-containing protein [Candidatus Aerophobetes bacterium]
MNKEFKPPEEWFKQADYDIKTAEAMFNTERYIYTVFMCHLSIEKALKGFYAKNLQKNPPKTHDLNYLSKKANLSLPEGLQSFMDNLNDLSVPTRYPDEIETLLKQYNKTRVKDLLKMSRELLLWLKERL